MSEPRFFEKIISGGQTGVDQGALDAALELSFPCGGWCPRERKSENGRIPDKYPLKEHPSSDYKARTKANVKDSDGTLIFTYGSPNGGTALTIKFAEKYAKPYQVIDLKQVAIKEAVNKVFTGWGYYKPPIYTLNVAGPRESKCPGIQATVKKTMCQAIVIVAFDLTVC
jgi:hypothetical protein